MFTTIFSGPDTKSNTTWYRIGKQKWITKRALTSRPRFSIKITSNLLINELIALYKDYPSNTNLLNFKIKDKLLTLNFSKEFLNDIEYWLKNRHSRIFQRMVL